VKDRKREIAADGAGGTHDVVRPQAGERAHRILTVQATLGVASLLIAGATLGWLIVRTPSSGNILAALVVVFSLSVIGVGAFLGPYWKRLDASRSLAAGVATSVALTGLLLTLLQSIPDANIGKAIDRGVGAPTSSGHASPAEGERVSDAYDLCVKQVLSGVGTVFTPPHGDVRGVVANVSSQGATVVVSDGVSTWACNVSPGLIVSYPGPAIVTDPRPSQFRIGGGLSETYYWGGGSLPLAATAIRFTFPDGHVENAVVDNGYWAMQYFPANPFPGDWVDFPNIEVTIVENHEGNFTSFDLHWGRDTCNQIGLGGC
jgi:hypothetical protein